MLKSFTVTGFKNFRDSCTIDFSKTRDYDFNTSLIKNGLVNKALLYGKNGSGKSNLGFALMDITTHLTDNQRNPFNYLFSLNGDSALSYMSFRYDFLSEGKEIVYDYKKDENRQLLEETISINGKRVFSYDYQTKKIDNSLQELKGVNPNILSMRNMNNSVIKTIYGFSAHLPSDSPIKIIMEFANEMLWFRSLGSYEYTGETNIVENTEQYIASDKNVLQRFQDFLKECGLSYSLHVVDMPGQKRIYTHFENKDYPLFDISSTGTKSLWLFFYWMNKFKGKISFLFLDEFDAFYHFNLSQAILKIVNSDNSFQSIVTTHNPYLADNSIMRPDCYLNLKDGKVKSFADSTNRVIRKGNSLDKMVLSDDL